MDIKPGSTTPRDQEDADLTAQHLSANEWRLVQWLRSATNGHSKLNFLSDTQLKAFENFVLAMRQSPTVH
jgi:hypothetical protein